MELLPGIPCAGQHPAGRGRDVTEGVGLHGKERGSVAGATRRSATGDDGGPFPDRQRVAVAGLVSQPVGGAEPALGEGRPGWPAS